MPPKERQFLEVFSGHAEITKALRAVSWRTKSKLLSMFCQRYYPLVVA